jgi:hypothetical protein
LAIALSFIVALTRIAPSVHACASVSDGATRVAIAGEQALIVWDAENKREHFIRSARFDTDAASFGFLVPVAAMPEIADADDSIIDRLDRLIEDRRPQQVSYTVRLSSLFLLSSRSSHRAPEGASSEVKVLAQQRVAGMDVVVLEADSAHALADWLGTHGYRNRPELSAWLAPYVAAHFKICAFNYQAQSPGANQTASVHARSVRLSFRTERPFFPYREPADAQGPPSRQLRILFLGPWHAAGSLGPLTEGAGGPPGAGRWDATTRFAGTVDDVATDFARLKSPWLTELIDTASRRSGLGDLIFSGAPDANPVAPPPIARVVAINIPAELLLLVLAAVIVIVVRRSRGR